MKNLIFFILIFLAFQGMSQQPEKSFPPELFGKQWEYDKKKNYEVTFADWWESVSHINSLHLQEVKISELTVDNPGRYLVRLNQEWMVINVKYYVPEGNHPVIIWIPEPTIGGPQFIWKFDLDFLTAFPDAYILKLN